MISSRYILGVFLHCTPQAFRRGKCYDPSSHVQSHLDGTIDADDSQNEDDYDSDPYENAPESGRLKMHWSTPRLPDFKRVLNPTRYDERVQKEKEREEEAKEAWKVGFTPTHPHCISLDGLAMVARPFLLFPPSAHRRDRVSVVFLIPSRPSRLYQIWRGAQSRKRTREA